MKLRITSSLDGGVMLNACLHADIIRQTHSAGSAILPGFQDIVAAFAFFFRLAINLLILRHYSTTLDFDL